MTAAAIGLWLRGEVGINESPCGEKKRTIKNFHKILISNKVPRDLEDLNRTRRKGCVINR